MRQVNTFSLGAAPGAVARLQREIAFPRGQQMTCVDVELAVPVRNTGGEPVDITADVAVKIGRALIGAWVMEFGHARPDRVDVGLTFDELRQFYGYLTGRDFQVQGRELRDWGNEPILTIAPSATVVLTLVVSRSFEAARLGADRVTWCPGATQARQMRIEIQRGAATLGEATGLTITQPDAADCTVVAHHVPEEAGDEWSPIIRMWRNAEAGLESAGPVDAGILLGVWEATAPGADTPLGIITLGRGEGEPPIHDSVQASRLVRQAMVDLPLGAVDIGEQVTMIYAPPERCRLNDLPTGRGWYVRQASQYVSPLRTVWIYVPEVAAIAEQIAGPNAAAADDGGGTVKITPALADRPWIRPQVLAVTPVSLIRPDAADYAVRPGIVVSRDMRAPVVDIPETVRGLVTAQVQAASDAAARTAAIAQGTASIARYLPGATAAASTVVPRRTIEVATALGGSAGAADLVRPAVAQLAAAR